MATTLPATSPEPLVRPALCARCNHKVGTRHRSYVRLDGSRIKAQGPVFVTCPCCGRPNVEVSALDTARA